MKVCLSSTAQDLVTYRQVVDDTILRLSHQSVAMERLGPLPGTPVEDEWHAMPGNIVNTAARPHGVALGPPRFQSGCSC